MCGLGNDLRQIQRPLAAANLGAAIPNSFFPCAPNSQFAVLMLNFFGIKVLYKSRKELPWNHILAKKLGGGGRGPGRTKCCSNSFRIRTYEIVGLKVV